MKNIDDLRRFEPEIDFQSEAYATIGQARLNIIRRSLQLRTKPLRFEKRIAVGRVFVRSPAVLRPLHSLNAGKFYSAQIKPFNFILSCHVKAFSHPIGADQNRFHLVAPYEGDARKWSELPWVDQYTASHYKISRRPPWNAIGCICKDVRRCVA